jgi:hypothetical protein
MAAVDQARRLATANIVRFQQLLASCTDDFQRQQLQGLMAREVERYKALPRSPGLSRQSAI